MFGGGDRSYGDANANDTSPWVVLGDLKRIAATDGTWTPVTVVAKRYNSSSPDCEAFIHDPIAAIMADVASRDPLRAEPEALEALSRVDRSWHASTMVVNHEATLSIKHLNVVVALMAGLAIAGIMMVKQAA
jgi:hypothetical protein